MTKKIAPTHPGEILREEFLKPLNLTPYAVAAALNVPRTRFERIAREEKPVTADTALRLGKYFKTGAAFRMNIQSRFDLETAEDELAPQIKKIPVHDEASRGAPVDPDDAPELDDAFFDRAEIIQNGKVVQRGRPSNGRRPDR